jgi:hypothetical protein
MTAVQAVPRVVGGREGRVLTTLRDVHRSWAQEIRRVLDSARRPEAGIHPRWRAVRYLSTIVSPRFEIERSGVEALNRMVGPGHAAQLWLAAELMVTLTWQLDHDLDLCHHAGEFSVLTHKFEKAMGHWCGAVEEALSGLSWGELPEQAERRFALLAPIFTESEPAISWAE